MWPEQLAGRAGIVAGCRQQNRVANGSLFFIATKHSGGYHSQSEGKEIAPAADLWRVGLDQIVQGFQRDTGREDGVSLADIAAPRHRPSRKTVRSYRCRGSGGHGRIHAAEHKSLVQFVSEI